MKDKSSSHYPAKMDVICAMKRNSGDDYTILRNFRYKVHDKGISTRR